MNGFGIKELCVSGFLAVVAGIVMAIGLYFVSQATNERSSHKTLSEQHLPDAPMGTDFPFKVTSDSHIITVMELQTLLQERGYYTGDIDGVVGPKTIAAWKRAVNDQYAAEYFEVTDQ